MDTHMAGGHQTAGRTPGPTVYVRNLNERVKIEKLTSVLGAIFERYGTIVDIVAKRNVRAKGQAFIVFDNVDSATRAIEELQGFEFWGRSIALDYARTPSDATVKRTGTADDFDQHKRKRLALKERRLAQEEAAKKLKRPAAEAPAKALRGTGLRSTVANAPIVPDEYLLPNKILFVQNLPDSYDADALSLIFNRFEGFREVRMVPGRKGIAFVEYEDQNGAIAAKERTAGMQLGDEQKAIKVTYQRQ